MDLGTQILIAGIFLFGVITQTLAGFGLGLVSLPLLVQVIGIRTAAPVVALVNFVAIGLIFIRYRRAFRFRAITPLLSAATVGIPLGVWGVKLVPEAYSLTGLGVIMLGYASYAFFGATGPRINHPAWNAGIGFIAGIFGGAYNSSGPAAIIYGHSHGWTPDEFRSNLQGFFIFNSLLINVTHAVSGNITTTVLHGFALAIPGMILGMAVGFRLTRFLSPRRFRMLVLILLALLGARLILLNALL